ncbi:hypothetical protein NIES2119_25590 [[Phormidium ambiguum] IAM M-71]|uniref:non-specific serine/threonine protein kinase n=1 Tax=[Phormidium ambiguum] IAM M-71 TaxID=454136 RepID=A0A1U7I8F0_9CYAN|nr:serine/threonine-protein kinase [Phormidium ambiguum]OKH32658.1 hypothetical protein NIES2119_25590 [Phormidium ambiguum IAM M-71]
MLPEITPGTAIGDRYQIQKVIGQGSFGRTYLASDTQRFGDACVLKEFVPSSKAEYTIRKARQLFEREAKVLYQIDHPQIPKFLAWFAANERLFLVQEYINGKTYSQILSERQQQGQLFSEAEVIQWLKDLLPVLDYLHKLNIIHRDISLENMMLPYSKAQPVLIDFGLVKEAITKIEFGDESTQQHYTQASIVGKYGYAPPEQIRLGQCYPCSDIYALGVCAVVLLTGKRPELLIDESLEWKWHSYTNVSDSLTQILNKMLAEKPKQRYQSAKEALTDIEPLAFSQKTSETLPLKKVEININKAQKERELVEIIESEEFKLLEQRANQLKKRRETSTFEETKISQTIEFQARTENIDILKSGFLEHCRQELIHCMGLMASIILEETLAQSPNLTPVQLVEALIAEIPNPQRAEDFRKRMQIFIKPEKLNSSENAGNTRSVLLYPKFLEHCQQEMSRCVGPIAMFVIEEILAQSPYLTPVELVEALVAEIPDAKRVEEFRKNIKIPS